VPASILRPGAAPLLAARRPAAGQEWSPRDYEGPRYVLTTDVDPASAQDHLRLLEAHYDVLAKLLVRKPDHEGRLVVRLFASPEDYRRIVRSDAGGIYTFHDRIANVSKQARRYWTRHLLLHEATHQYVLLAFAGNRDLLPWWLDEGLAEWGRSTSGTARRSGARIRT
jgi:hypothetical protein